MGQEVRDAVGTLLLQLTLKELFQWRFMQTDPNWGNFLYDAHSRTLHLIDFGACLRRTPACAPHSVSQACTCQDPAWHACIGLGVLCSMRVCDVQIILDTFPWVGSAASSTRSDRGCTSTFFTELPPASVWPVSVGGG